MTCPVCKMSDTAYLTCSRPDCTDGRHVPHLHHLTYPCDYADEPSRPPVKQTSGAFYLLIGGVVGAGASILTNWLLA